MKASFLLALLGLLSGEMFCLAADAKPDRCHFAAAMATLKPGMPADQVEQVLGRPDDTRTPYDPGGIPAARTTEIWCYGTDGHLSFPTLGCVYMEKGKVQYVYGGAGLPRRRLMKRTLNRFCDVLEMRPPVTRSP